MKTFNNWLENNDKIVSPTVQAAAMQKIKQIEAEQQKLHSKISELENKKEKIYATIGYKRRSTSWGSPLYDAPPNRERREQDRKDARQSRVNIAAHDIKKHFGGNELLHALWQQIARRRFTDGNFDIRVHPNITPEQAQKLVDNFSGSLDYDTISYNPNTHTITYTSGEP